MMLKSQIEAFEELMEEYEGPSDPQSIDNSFSSPPQRQSVRPNMGRLPTIAEQADEEIPPNRMSNVSM